MNTTTPAPAQRYAQVTERLAAIDRTVADIDQAEEQRKAHMARTLPELRAAEENYQQAEERLRLARAAHGQGNGLGELGSITRRGNLLRERDELQAELDNHLQPWAPRA